MSTKTKEQQLPSWFRGELYKEGATVQNRFSGEEYKLNAIELSMYDYIMGATMMMEMGMHHDKLFTNIGKGLNWFRKNNLDAYWVLLD